MVQLRPAGHAVAHAPQFAPSVCVFTQVAAEPTPHAVWPAAQVHAPALHT